MLNFLVNYRQRSNICCLVWSSRCLWFRRSNGYPLYINLKTQEDGCQICPIHFREVQHPCTFDLIVIYLNKRVLIASIFRWVKGPFERYLHPLFPILFTPRYRLCRLSHLTQDILLMARWQIWFWPKSYADHTEEQLAEKMCMQCAELYDFLVPSFRVAYLPK